MTHEFDFSVEANSAEEAGAVMQALQVFAQKFKPKELAKMGKVVATEPQKVKLLKAYLGL